MFTKLPRQLFFASAAVLFTLAMHGHAQAQCTQAFTRSHCPLGQATLSNSSSLVVGNIGSSGNDGVSIAIESNNLLDIQMPVIIGAPSGSYVESRTFGRVNGVNNQPSGRMRETYSVGDSSTLTPDFSDLGAPTYTLKFLNAGGQVLYSESGRSGPAYITKPPVVVKNSVSVLWGLYKKCTHKGWSATVRIVGGAGNGQTVSNIAEIDFVPDHPTRTVENLTKVEIRAKTVSSFSISDEILSSPPVPGPSVWGLALLSIGLIVIALRSPSIGVRFS